MTEQNTLNCSIFDAPAVKRKFTGSGTVFFLDIQALNFNRGELTFIIGPNGSGKSLFLRTLAQDKIVGAEQFTSTKLIDLEHERAQYVRQDPRLNLALSMTALENVALWCNTLSFREKLNPLSALAKTVEQAENEIPILRNVWHREVSILSGGQQQALVIFCRTLAQSTLFLLDEITASVDAVSAKPLMDYFRSWINAQNAATVIVSHDLSQVSEYADRVLVFANGKVIKDILTPEHGKFQASELSDMLHCAWKLHDQRQQDKLARHYRKRIQRVSLRSTEKFPVDQRIERKDSIDKQN